MLKAISAYLNFFNIKIHVLISWKRHLKLNHHRLNHGLRMAPTVSRLHLSSSSSSLAALYSQHRPLIQRCLNLSFTIFILASTARGVSGSGKPSSSSSHKSRKSSKDNGNKPARVQVDAVFWQRLRALLRIIIPGIRSKEALLLAMHTSLLVFRTAISLYVAALDGK